MQKNAYLSASLDTRCMAVNYDVTVGMPVYNVEHYVRKSLTSVLDQTFPGTIEVLVVDDCGTDASMRIVEELKASHTRGEHVCIVRQPVNRGVGAARNLIIEQARGRYLFFLDSDDYITPDCIGKLYEQAERHQTDVVYGSLQTVAPDGSPLDIGQDYLHLPSMTFEQTDAFASYVFQDTHAHLSDYMVNILYRKAFLDSHHLRYPNLRFHEDVVFSADVVPLVTRAVLLPDVTYAYVIRDNSLSNYQGRKAITLQEIETFFRIYTYVKDKNKSLRDKPYYEARCARSMTQMLFIVSGALKNRAVIHPPLSDQSIRQAMRHPASLAQVLRFRRHRWVNLAFCLIGLLPARLCVWVVSLIAKRKHLL